jgi:hypothetical protein
MTLPALPRDSRARPLLAVCVFWSLCSCQLGAPSESLNLKTATGATPVMVSVARAAQDCWFASKDRAFTNYRMADEINSPAGRPRILLVPRADPSGLPHLVIQAERRGDTATGEYTDIQAYGPMLSTASGKRITDDVARWAGGNSSC